MSQRGAPRQHKQSSRKSKRAWRKNVDIEEVEAGLETLREDIIAGGPLSEQPESAIFTVDNTASEAITRRFKLQKPLRADEILAKRSAVEPVDGRKRSGARITDGLLPQAKKQKSDWISKKEIYRLKDVAKHGSGFDPSGEDNETYAVDLWSSNATEGAGTGDHLDYIPKPRSKVAPKTLRVAPEPLLAEGYHVQAVKEPEAGTSYNPSFEDWDDLLLREGEKELAAERERRIRAEAEAERQRRVDASAAEAEEAERNGDESAWEGLETEPEDAPTIARKMPRRKTPAERNKVQRRKEAERLAIHEQKRAAKQQSAQVDKALQQTQSNADMAMTEAFTNLANGERDDTRPRGKRFGHKAIPDQSLELVLPDELQESLRLLKPEGNLLNERYRTLLVNGKLEVRKPVLQPKKKRQTVTEKWTYKDFSIQV